MASACRWGGVERAVDFIAPDAFLVSVLEIKLGGLKSLFQAEYAAGGGYNEQRAYGRVGVGR